jgi:hypothetical protein|tara:strand:- start:174 stop:365 length:192 start_codon:yes stop_codon:yes gene_type:complete
MREEEIIERRQYAQRVLMNLGIQPIKIDVIKGIMSVPANQVTKTKKIVDYFDWPLFVNAISKK